MTQALTSEKARRLPLLIQYIGYYAGQKGDNPSELARALGMTFGQWQALFQGRRSLSSLTALQLRVIAQYVSIPHLAAWVLAGKFHPSDFHMPTVATVERATGMQRLLNDETVGPFLPPQALTASAATQTLLEQLHEGEWEPRRSRLPSILKPIEAAVMAMEQVALEKEGNQ